MLGILRLESGLERLHFLLGFLERDPRPDPPEAGIAGVIPRRGVRDVDLSGSPDLRVSKPECLRRKEKVKGLRKNPDDLVVLTGEADRPPDHPGIRPIAAR